MGLGLRGLDIHVLNGLYIQVAVHVQLPAVVHIDIYRSRCDAPYSVLPFGFRLLCALLFFGLVLQEERLQFVHLLGLLLELLRLLLGLLLGVGEIEAQLVLKHGVYLVYDGLYLLLGAVEVIRILQIVGCACGERLFPPRAPVVGYAHQTTDGEQHLVEVIFVMIERSRVVRLKQAVDILGVFVLTHAGLEAFIAIAVGECLYGLSKMLAEIFGGGKYNLFGQMVAVAGEGWNRLQDCLLLHRKVCFHWWLMCSCVL